MVNTKQQIDPGAPARKIDEATATLFAALFVALANSRGGKEKTLCQRVSRPTIS